MKQIRCLLVLLIVTINLSSEAQKLNHPTKEIIIDSKDSILYNSLLKMDFNKYKGKSVASFLKGIKVKYVKYFAHTKKPGLLDYISFKYSDSLTIEIRVKNYKYLKRLDYSYKWDIEKFKKEKLYRACFKYTGECVKGCSDEDCE